MPDLATSDAGACFDLYIRSAEGSTYDVAADEQFTAAERVQWQPSQELTTQITRLFGEGVGIDTSDAHDRLCTAIGETIFRTFFVGPVAKKYADYRAQIREGARATAPRIFVHLPRTLYGLPWELLRDPAEPTNHFFAMHGSLVRFDADWEGRAPVVAGNDPPINLLKICSSPTARPFVGDFTVRRLAVVKFDAVNPPTYSRFNEAATDLGKVRNGFVFLGHGDVNEQSGYLLFIRGKKDSDADPRRADAIANSVKAMGSPIAVFLFACESAWARGRLPFEKTVAGTVLSQTTVPFVLGAQMELDLLAARTFIPQMFQSLDARLPLDLAMATARRLVRGFNPKDETQARTPLAWWVPVLYSRSRALSLRRDRRDSGSIDAVTDGTVALPQFGANLRDTIRNIARIAIGE